MKKIQIAKPYITRDDEKAVLSVLRSGTLSLGPQHIEFEKKIADFTGVKYAVGTNSGTSALHLIVRALGIGEGDEVITTPFSFIRSLGLIFFILGCDKVFLL